MADNIGPLAGVRVLAVEQFGAGPFATLALADMGAEVIKIEDPATGGDVARYVPPYEIEADSLYFQAFNRGKKSVALDLRSSLGRQAFEGLVGVSDAVFNNLRGDLPAKLGLTYDTLRALNPAVVTCSLSGFGPDGPRAAEPGYDAILQGLTGYMSVTGEPDAPPVKCGVSIIDFATGFAAGLGLTAALYDAKRSGRGRHVDVSLMDTAVSMLSYFAAWSLNRDWAPVRTSASSHQTLVPCQNFQTADGWVVVMCAKEVFWRRLVEGLGLSELADDPRFATFAARLDHRDELLPQLETAFERQGTTHWVTKFRGKVPIAPVNSLAEALSDEQLASRNMIVETNHPTYGRLRLATSPFKTPGSAENTTCAPKLAQHTREVLSELLGYSEEQVDAMMSGGG